MAKKKDLFTGEVATANPADDATDIAEQILANNEKRKEQLLLDKMRSRTAFGLASFYKVMNPGWELPPHLYAIMLALVDTRITRLMINLGPGGAKALRYGTQVLTPCGWQVIESLEIGDEVISPDGSVTTIIGVWPQPLSRLYEFEFEDGRKIQANPDHLWKCKYIGEGYETEWGLRSTKELLNYANDSWAIPRAEIEPDSEGKSPYVIIKSITPAEIETSLCITLASSDGLFLVDEFIVTHNSALTSIIYPAWLLGHDPRERILCISGGSELAEGFVHATMEYIEDPKYRLFFPDRLPNKEAGWSAGRGVYVTGRPTGLSDASYFAAGLTSRTLPGKHGTTLIMDDLHNRDNSTTKDQRDQVIGRYYSDLLGRQDPTGARLIVVGRRWDQDDLYGHLKESEGDWTVLTLPNERPDSKKYLYWDVQVPDDLECVFSELGDSDEVDIAKMFATEGADNE